MKTLNEYLAELKPLLGSNDPKERARMEEIAYYIRDNFTTPEDKETLNTFFDAGITELENDIKELTLKEQLADISEMVSLSYIAKKYFNKSRGWLYQRINGNIVRNKPAKFTDAELSTLQFALKDIGNKLNSIALSNV